MWRTDVKMLNDGRKPASYNMPPRLALRLIVIILIVVAVHYFLPYEFIRDSCYCVDVQGRSHDFCYRSKVNSSAVGKKFSCSYLDKLEELGLLNNSPTENVSYNSEPVFVTAFSQSHFMEGKRLIASIRAFYKQVKVVVYDIGLTRKKAAQVKRWCNVEYRPFPFEHYPRCFLLLHTFRWKPIVIADALKDNPAVWYMDTSVILMKKDLRHIYALLKCRQRSRAGVLMPSSLLRDLREFHSASNHSWDTVQWTANLEECKKSPYLLHSFSGHGIYAATDPSLYTYFPVSLEELRKPKAKMFEAGLVYAVRLKETIELMKWSVLCALEEHCMGTTIVPNICEFNRSDLYSSFAHCHRYDQSVINVLLADAYYYDRHYYTSEINDFFRIQRFISRPVKNRELKCT
ncbi:unnamed protein product [Cylicocyclus nassatus]|uniref:Uncharacterized protein n=1 Tax=Cylicocyclus nassatus TaxID=53992 RepID=A0AA36HDX3_CYLNA|nr:unnamed protein product [Cylicocyclus nassatus]